MSVAGRFGYNPEKTEHLGKIFNTIDFERSENYDSKDFKEKRKNRVCGKFMIGNKEHQVTYHELERINEIAKLALQSLQTGYKIGIL